MIPRTLGIRAFVLPLALALAACGQSQQAGVKLLCDKANVQTAMGGATGAAGIAKLAAWAETAVTNPEAKKVVAALAAAEPSARNSILLKAKTDAQLDECLAAGLFVARPFATDPRDAAARDFAFGLGKQVLAGFLGQPVDPAYLAADPSQDVRKIACGDVDWKCTVPADRWNSAREKFGANPVLVGVALQLVVEKGSKALHVGFIAWDDARARSESMGQPVQWLAVAEGKPATVGVSDPAAVTARAPALQAFADRTLACLAPPACALPFRATGATGVGGIRAEQLLDGNDLVAGERAVGEAAEGATGWKIIDIQVKVLVAGDASSDAKVRDTGAWLDASLLGADGKLTLGPLAPVHRADDI